MKDCWIWTGRKNSQGYARFTMKGKNYSIARIMYRMRKGQLKGLYVLHKCDTPACINPEHLFLGTQQDNMRDREIKGRGKHPKGEAHGSAKLTTKQALAILHDKRKHRQIAQEFNVSVFHVRNIKNGSKWKHLREKQELTMAKATKTAPKKVGGKSAAVMPTKGAKPVKGITAPMKKAKKRG